MRLLNSERAAHSNKKLNAIKTYVALCLGFLIGRAGLASEGEINVGDRAPKIAVRQFVKGEPVTDLDKSKVYVIEFWATWCKPCRSTIPHLTQLQKAHEEVTVIGVSVYENNQAAVKPFVNEMGDKMAYRVAIDAIPENGNSMQGFMAKNWLEAAAEQNIPIAFIIN